MEDSEPGRLDWCWSVGMDQRIVTVYEEPRRGGTLYLRWRESKGLKRNWVSVSLQRKLRDGYGRIHQQTEAWAKAQAREKYRALGPAAAPVAPDPTELTIGQAAAKVIDPDRGLYPKPGQHRSEVLRALAFAAAVWGEHQPWSALRKADLRALWRRRLEQLQRDGYAGARGAEVTVSRVLTVAAWLRDEELIPAHACVPPRKWKQVLAGEAGNPDPKRPRYTLDEMRALLKAAADVEPRLALLVALGAELRLGQVVRVRRTDLNLEAQTLTVRGAGKKRGTVVGLTPGQLAAAKAALATGYLKYLNGGQADYYLFPGGKLERTTEGVLVALADRKPVSRRTVGLWWHRAERVAGITHEPGRAAYGVRRAAVDGFLALGISPKALENAGGWENAAMPNQVYAAKDLEFARVEASKLRAQLRGEVDA